MNKNYIIDMKLYATVPQEEISIRMPIEQITNGKVSPGLHQFIWEDCSERDLDIFMEKSFSHPDLKILGVYSVIVNQ